MEIGNAEFDNPVYQALSPQERDALLARCNEDPAFKQMEKASEKRWSWIPWRVFVVWFISLLLWAKFVASIKWAGVLCSVALCIAWFLFEFLMWLRWYKRRWGEIAYAAFIREVGKLPGIQEATDHSKSSLN